MPRILAMLGDISKKSKSGRPNKSEESWVGQNKSNFIDPKYEG